MLAVPASWLSGAMVAVTAASLGRLDTRLPAPVVELSFLLIGIALGAGLTPELLRSLGAWPFSLAVLVLTVILVTAGVRGFLVHVSGWDRETAFFAAVPGALSYVIAVADTAGADIRKVAVSQGIRIFLLVAALPAIIVALEGGPPAARPIPATDWGELAILVVVSTVVGVAFRQAKIPAGLLTGSFAGSAFLHGSGLVVGTLPQPAIIFAFVLLGALVRCADSGSPDLAPFSKLLQSADSRRITMLASILGVARAVRRRVPSPVLGVHFELQRSALVVHLAGRGPLDAEEIALERQQRRFESAFGLGLIVSVSD